MNITEKVTAPVSVSITIREEVMGSGNLVYSLIRTNVMLDERPVCVYGIRISSSLFQKEEVECVPDVSSDFSMVNDLFEMLVRNMVLPCTLKDIISDYLVEAV